MVMHTSPFPGRKNAVMQPFPKLSHLLIHSSEHTVHAQYAKMSAVHELVHCEFMLCKQSHGKNYLWGPLQKLTFFTRKFMKTLTLPSDAALAYLLKACYIFKQSHMVPPCPMLHICHDVLSKY